MPSILIVDDDEQFRSMLREVLAHAGYQVLEAANGAKAIKLYETHPTDLVITDLIMPEKDGLEMILEFKRLSFAAKIIAVSGAGGHGSQDYLRIAKALGAARVLPKPFSTQEILETVSQVLQGITLDIAAREREEEGFRRLIEGAPNGMVIMDQTGKIVLLNSRIEACFGYGREELLGKRIEILAPKRFHGDPIFSIKSLRFPPGVESVQAETLYARRKDGSEFPVEIRLNRLRTDRGFMVMWTIIEITEQKPAEGTLRSQK